MAAAASAIIRILSCSSAILFVGTVFLLVLPCVAAQVPTFVTLTVIAQVDGLPAQNVEIILLRDNIQIDKTVTGADGAASFYIQVGVYTVIIAAPNGNEGTFGPYEVLNDRVLTLNLKTTFVTTATTINLLPAFLRSPAAYPIYAVTAILLFILLIVAYAVRRTE